MHSIFRLSDVGCLIICFYLRKQLNRTTVELFAEPNQHFERASTKRRFHNLLCASNFIDQLVTIKPRYAEKSDITACHSAEWVNKVEQTSATQTGGYPAPLVVVGPGSYEIALLSAGGCLSAIDAIMKGEVRNAYVGETPRKQAYLRNYALVRPPGHHAEPESGMGFCIFNNVAITALYARRVYGIEKIAIVDWDVHHGNGTQKAFYSDPNALFISVHQNGNYPIDQGFISENGEGAGEGYNINIPLPPGCGHGAYDAAFERVIVPALTAFKPQLILVSSGFDACFMDPQASMMLSSTDFRYMTRLVKQVADKYAQGRLLICHEGGYSDEQVPFCGVAVIEELSGLDSGVEDPFAAEIRMMGEQDLQPHQDARIKQCEELVAKLKKLCAGRNI